MVIFIPSVESILRSALNLFEREFETSPEIAACAPGRVNLIGEHTDYNDGFVLPMALPLVTIITGKANGTHHVRIYSSTTGDIDCPHKIQFSTNEKIEIGKPKWANYVKGVIAEFKEASVPGFDAIIVSSVPAGGGVSSSAALEVATYTFLEILTGKKTKSDIMKAQICQKAEHLYAGVPCGIMDQLVSICGQENQALLIDCRTLEMNYVPLDDPQVAVLITNSNIKHELSGSEYAIRRKQCEEVANLIGKSLRDAVESDLLTISEDHRIEMKIFQEIMLLNLKAGNSELYEGTNFYLCFELEETNVNKTLIARARHVITENKRTIEGANTLNERNYVKFGELMVESHYSLRDDFQVSCKELDEIVEASLEVPGVFGSRMTGGGFGGCTVTLVKMDAVDQCIANIRRRYSGDPVFYLCKPSGGAKPLPVGRNLKTEKIS